MRRFPTRATSVLCGLLMAWWISFPCVLAECLAAGEPRASRCGLGQEHIRGAQPQGGTHACRAGCCGDPAPAGAPADEEPCSCPCTAFGGCKRALPAPSLAVELPDAGPLDGGPALGGSLAVAVAPPVLAGAAQTMRHSADPPFLPPVSGRYGPTVGLALLL